MDYSGKSFEFNFQNLKTSFTVRKQDHQNLYVVDVMGKNGKIPLKFFKDGLEAGYIKQAAIKHAAG
jgi:hypothetical protein